MVDRQVEVTLHFVALGGGHLLLGGGDEPGIGVRGDRVVDRRLGKQLIGRGKVRDRRLDGERRLLDPRQRLDCSLVRVEDRFAADGIQVIAVGEPPGRHPEAGGEAVPDAPDRIGQRFLRFLLAVQASSSWRLTRIACLASTAVWILTVIVNDRDWLLPALSVAEHVTVVIPIGNVEPEAGVHAFFARPLVASPNVAA